MFYLEKHSTVVGLLWFSPYLLFECAASSRANLVFKTTIIEDTHLTLAGIPFKAEANNSLIFLLLQTYEKKFAKLPFLFIFIIPCLVLCTIEIRLLYLLEKFQGRATTKTWAISNFQRPLKMGNYFCGFGLFKMYYCCL